MKPQIISNKKVYQGKVFDVFLSKIREGKVEYERDIISHHGSAVIVPIFADQTIALVKQYRHAAGKYLFEIPAGSLDENESPETGAHRELEEEIGVVAGKIEKLAEFYVSPGFLAEKMFVFLATDLRETAQNLEDDELIEITKITFPKAFEMIKHGEIEDAKTIIGLILAGTKFGFVYQ